MPICNSLIDSHRCDCNTNLISLKGQTILICVKSKPIMIYTIEIRHTEVIDKLNLSERYETLVTVTTFS